MAARNPGPFSNDLLTRPRSDKNKPDKHGQGPGEPFSLRRNWTIQAGPPWISLRRLHFMNDFMRIDELGCVIVLSHLALIKTAFNFLIERRKQLYKDSEIRLLRLSAPKRGRASAKGTETVPFRTCTRQLHPPTTACVQSSVKYSI